MREFHIPFHKSLYVVAVVTIVAMISSHFFIKTYLYTPVPTPIFTSIETPDNKE